MIETIPYKSLVDSVEHKRDFYKSELLGMGYFKTPDNKQLYELSLSELECIYLNQKARLSKNDIRSELERDSE